MNKIELPVQTLKLALAIALVLPSFTPVQAQPVNPLLVVQRPTSNSNSSRQLDERSIFAVPPPPDDIDAPGRRWEAGSRAIFAAPPPPDNIEAPGRRSEAGSRGCGELGKQPTASQPKHLTALVPLYPNYKPLNSKLVLGATTAERPTFWFYVPYQSPLTGTFVLQDRDENLVYETEIALPGTPGVISLSLPSTAAPLEIGKLYRWYFKIDCTQPPLFVDGWIQRNSLNPTVESQLENATPQERVVLYAANGVWHEALTTASELHRLNPSDTHWAALLQAVGLNDLAGEPIVECCQMEKL